MQILTPLHWTDYALLDSGNAKRLERFGRYTISRPDPQAIWQPTLPNVEWEKVDAAYERLKEDKGNWKINKPIPDKWLLHYKNLSFYAKLTPFKHTGVFPEQAVHWDFITNVLSQTRIQPNILNLFAYTGIASLAAAASGAMVTHVDASKSSIAWAKANQKASHLTGKPIRWIVDDAIKFTAREIKRGKKYDAIILDPPIFGHGPDGRPWKLQDDLPLLLANCEQLLSNNPIFIIINAYAISASSLMPANLLTDITKKYRGTLTYGELVLRQENNQRLLSTGIFASWYSKYNFVKFL